MNIVIFDDEEYCQKMCIELIHEFNRQDSFSGEKLNIVLCTGNYKDVINYFIMEMSPTIYLIDIIVMKDEIGFQLVDQILKSAQISKVIFMTSYPELIVNNFRYKDKCLDFLLKGTKNFKEGLFYWLERAVNLLNRHNVFEFQIQSDKYSVLFHDIYFFEKLNLSNRTIIYHRNGSQEFYKTLEHILNKLDRRFFQCHRAYVVNGNKIKGFDKKQLFLDNGMAIPYVKKRIKGQCLTQKLL